MGGRDWKVLASKITVFASTMRVFHWAQLTNLKMRCNELRADRWIKNNALYRELRTLSTMDLLRNYGNCPELDEH
jgi:hypothetical protein